MANFVQKFIARIFPQSKKLDKPVANLIPFQSFASFGIPYSKLNEEQLLEKFDNGWVFACVSKISEECAKVKIRLYKKDGDDIEEVTDHEAIDILDRVNPFMTFYNIKERTFQQLELVGNSYWWLIKNKEGKIIEIYPLKPHLISVIPDATEFIKGYEYIKPDSGERIQFASEDILHFQYSDPNDIYYGKGAMSAAQLAVASDESASNWNYNFFKNNARPSGALEFERPLSEERLRRIESNWEAKHGEGKEHRIAVLGGGKYKDIGFTQKDMDFQSMRTFLRDEILAIFRVPKSMLGITEDVNRANAEESRNTFLRDVITPKVTQFVNYLNEFYITQFDNDNLFFDFDNPVPKSDEMKLKRYENARKWGWMAPNEIREKENLEPVEGGDEITTQANIPGLPVGNIEGEKMIVKSSKSKYEPNVDVKSKSKIDIIKKRIAEMADIDIDKKSKVSPKKRKTRNAKKKIGWKQEDMEQFWREKIAITDVIENNFEDELKKQFNRQRREVLSSVKTKSVKTITFIFNLVRENELFLIALQPIIDDILRQFGESTLNQLGLSGFDTTDNVLNYLDNDGVKFISEANETTKRYIREQIKEGLADGEALPKIERRIGSVFTQATRDRTKVIARTETARASNYGQWEAYRQSGVVTAKQWVTALDERVCPYCGAMEGKVIKLEDNYFDKGDSFLGNASTPLKLDFSDTLVPPLHPRCRCTMVPITSSIASYDNMQGKIAAYDEKKYREYLSQGYDQGVAYAMSRADYLDSETKEIKKQSELDDKEMSNLIDDIISDL